MAAKIRGCAVIFKIIPKFDSISELKYVRISRFSRYWAPVIGSWLYLNVYFGQNGAFKLWAIWMTIMWNQTTIKTNLLVNSITGSEIEWKIQNWMENTKWRSGHLNSGPVSEQHRAVQKIFQFMNGPIIQKPAVIFFWFWIFLVFWCQVIGSFLYLSSSGFWFKIQRESDNQTKFVIWSCSVHSVGPLLKASTWLKVC
jgi:hypothetical protein